MTFRVITKIEGIGGLISRLDGLGKRLRNTTLRKAVGRAGRIVAKAAKQKAPVGAHKLLKKSIGSKVKTYKDTGVVIAIVGPRTGYKQAVGVRTRGKRKGATIYANPALYAHLVELGTSRAAAHPFLVPALEDTKPQVIDAMTEIIKAGLERGA